MTHRNAVPLTRNTSHGVKTQLPTPNWPIPEFMFLSRNWSSSCTPNTKSQISKTHQNYYISDSVKELNSQQGPKSRPLNHIAQWEPYRVRTLYWDRVSPDTGPPCTKQAIVLRALHSMGRKLPRNQPAFYSARDCHVATNNPRARRTFRSKHCNTILLI